MMGITTGKHLQMQADAGVVGDGFHDVAHERTREMASNHTIFEAFRLAAAHTVRSAGDVDYRLGQRLIQRHGGIGEATDATLVAKRLLQRLAKYDGDVFHGMMRVDVGITGHDLLLNSGTDAKEHMQLGFGASTFRFAAPNESPISTLEDIEGKRVATSFDKLVHDYLVEHGINAETVHLDGAVESSVQLGVADLIADVVSTGTTLRNAGLRIFADPLLHSEAVLIRSPRLNEDDDRLTILSRRLQGVLTAQRYVLMDYDIPVEKVSAAVSVTPGFESPTISPLHNKQWAAVRVVVPKAKVNQLMDQLYGIGARGIIVTALQASRM